MKPCAHVLHALHTALHSCQFVSVSAYALLVALLQVAVTQQCPIELRHAGALTVSFLKCIVKFVDRAMRRICRMCAAPSGPSASLPALSLSSASEAESSSESEAESEPEPDAESRLLLCRTPVQCVFTDVLMTMLSFSDAILGCSGPASPLWACGCSTIEVDVDVRLQRATFCMAR